MNNKKLQKIKTHFKNNDPVIYAAMDGLNFDEWIEIKPKEKYFESLCRSIISQQLATGVARAINKRFVSLFHDEQIEAKKILKLQDKNIREIGVSWAKIKYIKDLSEKQLSGEIDLYNIDDFSDEEIIRKLTKVKGIGPWTAEMFLIFTLGREDVFSYGDLGLKRGLEKLYKIEDPSLVQIENIINKWSPYKSYGSITLWNSLETT